MTIVMLRCCRQLGQHGQRCRAGFRGVHRIGTGIFAARAGRAKGNTERMIAPGAHITKTGFHAPSTAIVSRSLRDLGNPCGRRCRRLPSGRFLAVIPMGKPASFSASCGAKGTAKRSRRVKMGVQENRYGHGGPIEQVDCWGRCDGGIGEGSSTAVGVSSGIRGRFFLRGAGAVGAGSHGCVQRVPRCHGNVGLDLGFEALQSPVPAAGPNSRQAAADLRQQHVSADERDDLVLPDGGSVEPRDRHRQRQQLGIQHFSPRKMPSAGSSAS
jgi:hypothetical protein